MERWSLARVVAIVLQAVWVLVLGGAFVLKLADDGASALAHYLTNWVWLANFIFFLIDLVLGYAEKTRVFDYFSFYAIWVVYGLNWTVFWLVFPLVRENPRFLLDLVKELSLSVITVGDRLLHVLTLVLTLLWILLRSAELRRAFGVLASEKTSKLSAWWRFVLVWLLAGVVAPLLVVAIYRLCNDPHRVYGVTLPEVGVAIAAAFILVIVNGLTLYGVSGLGHETLRYGFFLVLACVLVFGAFVLLGWWLVVYDIETFVSHFEIWVLSYEALYLLVCIFATPFMRTTSSRRAKPAARLSTRASIVAIAFWPLNSLVWSVFWLSFVALGESPWHVLDIDENGRITGEELLLDRLVRVLPLIVLLVYVFVWRDSIIEAVSSRRARLARSFALYVLVVSWLVPLAIFGLWLAIFSPRQVYGLTSPVLAWLALQSLISLSFGAGTMLLFKQR